MTTPDYKKELQEFVGIISHDLRAPVRHIKSFHSILMKDIELTEKQQAYKGYVDKAINKLEAQLEAVLSLSRINTTALTISSVNVKELIEEIIVALGEDITNGCQISLAIECSITIESDRNRLYRAYFEVLSNACKFHLPHLPANVTVQAKIQQSKLILTVLDQGIGIEEKNVQAIYLPFRCLNHEEDFSGLGIGLTLSQKNMHSLNGSIEVSKNDKQGCNFTLITPIA